MAEQLICNQQVVGSTPIASSIRHPTYLENRIRYSIMLSKDVEGFPSGQRGRTVNPLAELSMVRIHLPPPIIKPAEAYLQRVHAEVAQG